MSRTKLLLSAVLLAAAAASATDKPIQVISLSTASAVVSNKVAGGQQYSLSCDGPIRLISCATSSCTATTTDPLISDFSLPVDVCLPLEDNYLSLIRTGGVTVTCTFSRVNPKTGACSTN